MPFKRKNLTSPRLKTARRKAIIKRAFIFGALIVSIFLGARTFLNLNFLAINSINVVGAQKTSTEEIKSIVASELSGRWLGIIPKDNFLFMGKSAIVATILKSFPGVAAVRTSLAGVGNLTVLIEEKIPYAKWCAIATLPKHCLMIDDSGFAFEQADQTASTTLTIYTSFSPRYSADIFEKEKFVKLRQFIDSFKSFGLGTVSVTEKDTDYFIKLGDGSEVRVKNEDKSDDIARKLSAVRDDLQKEGKGATVEYIDLRYGNKVYLKMK